MGARTVAWWASAVVAMAACVGRELDPAACAARFDVQRDKIIRTEESREMGARYLSELDVGAGARGECLRLCCETEACDVFVYEEKGPGSCYLFKCGPPEDFRCKFTAHGNFSSGVLALSRRLAELQDRDRLADHERALASLRMGSSSAAPPPPPSVPVPPPLPHADPPPQAPLRDESLSSLHIPAAEQGQGQGQGQGACSRYQFECRRGGECIAVYNACDGVPQCADGSDEAPELGCPAPAPAPVATRAPSPPPPPPRSTPRPLPLLESVESRDDGGGEDGVGARWPHRLALAQPQYRYNSEAGPSSHIFSHKGGLLQEAEEPPAAPAPRPYPPFQAPYQPPRRAWTLHQGLENMGGWSAGDADGGSGPYPRLEWGAGGGGGGAGDTRRAWPVPQPPAPAPVGVASALQPDQPPPPPPSAEREHTLRDSAKKGLDLQARPPAEAVGTGTIPKTPSPPAPEPTPHPTPRHYKAEIAGRGAAAARVDLDEADGLSERPPSAVLLLVLGTAMTAALGGMLGCRARAARRRLRRGKPFAHDADYLVNGMYL